MGKFYGTIGFAESKETSPGVWKNVISERNYYGDVTRLNKRWDVENQVNDNIALNNELSIVADPYAYDHFTSIIYVEWMGVKWKVSTVEVRYPRLVLWLGGVYHGESP